MKTLLRRRYGLSENLQMPVAAALPPSGTCEISRDGTREGLQEIVEPGLGRLTTDFTSFGRLAAIRYARFRAVSYSTVGTSRERMILSSQVSSVAP